MADGTTDKPDAPEEAAGRTSDEKHGVEGWKERAGWLDCSPHAVAGALADLRPGQTLTQKQVEARVEKFLARPGV